MELKIRDDKKLACEVWLRQAGDNIELCWQDETGTEFAIATLYPSQVIKIWDGSHFERE